LRPDFGTNSETSTPYTTPMYLAVWYKSGNAASFEAGVWV
jgi:hypothetical protein